MRSPSLEEEGVQGHEELTTSPILHPPVLLRGVGRENVSELDPGKKRRMGGRCF